MRKYWIRIRGAGPSRWLLAAILLAVIVVPLPGQSSGPQQSARALRQQENAERWTARLPGQWTVAAGTAGTVPVGGQAYVAAGGGLAVAGAGLTVSAYHLSGGAPAWQLTLNAPAGSKIVSVRAWPGVVTVGVASPSGTSRTETVIGGKSGTVLGTHPASPFGGAVEATDRATVIIGHAAVTSYDNATGRVRWQRRIAGGSWRADGATLYVAEQRGGAFGAGPVTGLQVIDLGSGTERIMSSPNSRPFPGTVSAAADGAVLFTSASGVTAYSGWTGGELWSAAGAVPEGSDPVAGLLYLTAPDGSLTGVNPVTGRAVTSVPGSAATGSAGMYVVRGGVALGLDSGSGGEAWGYGVTGGRVTWTVPNLPWPHYFSDLSGIGGSAAMSPGSTASAGNAASAGNPAGNTVLIAACPHLAPATPGTAAPSPPASPSSPGAPSPGAPSPGAPSPGAPSPGQSGTVPSEGNSGSAATAPALPGASPSPVQLCADPELVALSV